MIDEYYTLSAVSLVGVLLCAVMLGVCFAFVALLVAAGARQSRRDQARIRAYVGSATGRRCGRIRVGPRGAA